MQIHLSKVTVNFKDPDTPPPASPPLTLTTLTHTLKIPCMPLAFDLRLALYSWVNLTQKECYICTCMKWRRCSLVLLVWHYFQKIDISPSSNKDKNFRGESSKIIIVIYEATLEFAQQKRIIELSLMLILVSMIIIGTFIVLTANSHSEEFGKNCSRKCTGLVWDESYNWGFFFGNIDWYIKLQKKKRKQTTLWLRHSTLYTVNIRGAYHLTENFGNSRWKVNGKVTFWKFQPKIEEYVLR